ncbi:MAG: hypothetical protein AB7G11_04120, partial [Phycisphaerales bacterium]
PSTNPVLPTPSDSPPPAPSQNPITPAATSDASAAGPAPAASQPNTPAAPNQGLTKDLVGEAVAKARRDAALNAARQKDPAPATTDTAPPSPPSAPLLAPEGVKLDRKDDGTYLVDDRYTLRGDGSIDHPFEVSWDYLTSAEETYQPRLGKKTIPPRLSMLNDHYVKISGYVAFPIMASEPTEMLSMLNQWDGCCIGVPPTPYDAIEVKLNKPAEGEDRLASYGSVKGKFRVDPYLVKDWLVSLYIMEEGEVARQ